MFDLKKLGAGAAEFVELLADGTSLIGNIVKTPAIDKAGDILTVVKVVIDSLVKAYDGKVSADAVRKDWKRLQLDVSVNDAKADQALADKFDNSDIEDK